MQASSLEQLIWQIVAAIPAGFVASYGQIAQLAGYPSHARYVGTTLRHLPAGSTLPWFRVVRSNGELAFPVGSSAWKRQHRLLKKDGVRFRNDKVAMTECRWQPGGPSQGHSPYEN